MGSYFRNLFGNFARCVAYCALIVFSFDSASLRAAGEAVLLPGYVQPRNPNAIATIGNQTPPPVLPGWVTVSSPGFVLQPNPSGLKLIVDNSWPDLPGYRMVRLEFLANPVTAEERRLRVQLKFQNSNYGRAEVSVTTDEIVLPAGQSAVKYQLYYPSQGQQRIQEVRTTEDGEAWPDLACRIFTGQSNSMPLPYLDLRGLQPKAAKSPPSLLNIQGAVGIGTAPGFVNQSETHEYRNGVTFSYPINLGWSGIRNYAELPNNPLGFDCFKIIFCYAEQLTELETKHPTQWHALRSWVATGGKLLVFPTDNNNANSTPELQLQLDELFPHGESADKKIPSPAWSKQTISTYPESLQQTPQNVYFEDDYITQQSRGGIPANPLPVNGPTVDYPERAWYQGTLVVLPSEQHLETIYSHLQNASQQPVPSTPLPLVGLPPITMFQILITLFVILIGPVNYFYFKKKKKLNWLLITVPAGALAITGLLLAYTLLKDGVGVRTWSQSYTVLDQVQKHAATRQQFCLFAGITPGDGLRFGPQVKCDDLSVAQTTNFNYRYRDPRNWDYAWDPPENGSSSVPEQHLRSGWLPARTLKLLETSNFDACQRELQIRITGDNCQLVNKLGIKIVTLYVADGERVWSATEIAVDGSTSANLASEATALNLQTSLEQELFQPTSDFAESDRRVLPPQDRTIQEQFLGMRRLNPRVYLAVVERWPDLPSGVANPTVESWGPHVILGVW